MGPSPRIRGKYDPGGIITLTARAIPANTGRIISLARIARTTRDHPREYGENRKLPRKTRLTTGSSPRIRGESGVGSLYLGSGRIIPANTGRIATHGEVDGPSGDHPREYGENSTRPSHGLLLSGSSPRIRGECDHWYQWRGVHRIIPANTGRMSRAELTRQVAGDHPREYGENFGGGGTQYHVDVGSSPRIRGKSFS